MRKTLVISFISLFLGTGYVLGQNSLNVGSAAGDPGTDVQIAVTLTADKKIAGVQFDLLFDQTKLQIKTAANGTDAAAMTSVGLDVAGANTTGKLSVSMVDFSFSNPIAAGTNKQVYLVTFTIASAASGEIPITLSGVSLSDELAADVPVTLNAGKVSVSATLPPPWTPPSPPTDQNLVVPYPVEGNSGDAITTNIDINTLVQIAGAQFRVAFDKSLITITEVKAGAGASTFTIVGLSVADANTNGYFDVSMVDFTFASPIQIGLSHMLSVGMTFQKAGVAKFTVSDIQMSDPNASSVDFAPWTYDLPTPVDAENVPGSALPKAFSLSRNSPNPFNPSTTVDYEVAGKEASASHVTIQVFNLRGQLLATLVDEMKPAGRYSVQWSGLADNGARLSSGVYFYRMQTDKFTQTRKMVILK